jgi:hypothetical protein
MWSWVSYYAALVITPGQDGNSREPYGKILLYSLLCRFTRTFVSGTVYELLPGIRTGKRVEFSVIQWYVFCGRDSA